MNLRATLLLTTALISGFASAQLRIATWNVTNWGLTSLTGLSVTNQARVDGFRTSFFGTFQGRSFAPDVVFLQEMISFSALQTFQQMVNTAPGSPGDYAIGSWPIGNPFPDTNSGILFRTSRVQLVSPTPVVVSEGATDPEPPRDTYRYEFFPVGYNAPNATVSVYITHMKSSSSTTDQARRLVEAQRIRLNSNNLPPSRLRIVAGDFNIQSSSQAAYVELTGNQMNNLGRFIDPIRSEGAWNNNSAWRFVHTQDPWFGVGSGGMDDRLDMILMSSGLLDGEGLSYIGNSNIPYSTTTWNDPNHSYRSWGNDGTSYNAGLTIAGNTMVGPTIAQALVNSTGNMSGHLPVFADLRVPPRAGVSSTSIDFGYVESGEALTVPITVINTGNTALWSAAGIAPLTYTLDSTAGFTVPTGTFNALPGTSGNAHSVTVHTNRVGRLSGSVTITTNDPVTPTLTVSVTGVVVGRLGLAP